VAWAEQFPRGGGLSGACYVLYMCRPAMHPGRVYLSHSSLTLAWLLLRGSQELGRSPASLRLHACVWGFYSISAEYLFWRGCTLRVPNIRNT